jgi:hypothetical protein
MDNRQTDLATPQQSSGPLSDLNLPRIRSCPEPDHGVHKWLFYAAATLAPHVPTERDEELEAFIEARMTRPPTASQEAGDAIRAARRLGSQSTPIKRAERVCFDPYRAQAMAQHLAVGDYADYLASHSPINPEGVSFSAFIDALYPSGEVVLLFMNEKNQGFKYTVECA